jgi:hypothetical protein
MGAASDTRGDKVNSDIASPNAKRIGSNAQYAPCFLTDEKRMHNPSGPCCLPDRLGKNSWQEESYSHLY